MQSSSANPAVNAQEELESRYRAECMRDSDIREHLPTLRWYAEKCERVTEFGVRTAVSSLAFLAARPKRMHSYDVNWHANIADLERFAAGLEVEFRFFQADVRSIDIEPTDLLFIDTLHRYEQLKIELEKHAPLAGRFIILHDTMTYGWKGENGRNSEGLLTALHEFLYRHKEWRILESFANNNGLTVLGREAEWNGPRVRPIRHCVRRGDRELNYEKLLGRPETIFSRPPKLGLVLGTFASIPYVHLQLEARRRLYPDVKMLVHDDCSPRQEELRTLCEEYGVEFESNLRKYEHSIGDLSAFLSGMLWAREQGIELLVKLSRRFLPLVDWRPELLALAQESQHPTYSSWTRRHGLGFRTECMALAVNAWFQGSAVSDLANGVFSHDVGLVEAFMHGIVRRLAETRCQQARAFDERYGYRPHEINGYAIWPFMGFDRGTRYPEFLTYETSSAAAFAEIAKQWGLSYSLADFEKVDGFKK